MSRKMSDDGYQRRGVSGVLQENKNYYNLPLRRNETSHSNSHLYGERKSSSVVRERPLPATNREVSNSFNRGKRAALPTLSRQSSDVGRRPSFSQKEAIDLTEDLKKTYGADIEKWLRHKERANPTTSCLEAHKISPFLRARMVDWMIEVLTNYHCADQSFFLAVNLMDRHTKNVRNQMQSVDIHLIGVACMFVASKYEDIYPLKLQVVYEKIGHRKLSKSTVKDAEKRILESIGYNLCTPTILEFIEKYLNIILDKKDFAKIRPTCLHLAKLIQHEYTFCGVNASLLAASVIDLSAKAAKNGVIGNLFPENYIKELSNISNHSAEAIATCNEKILHLTKTFTEVYSGLDNLKRTSKISLDTLSFK